jgi:hypothetical protein
MARNKTLISLLQDYRIEVGASTNPAHNSNARDAQVYALQQSQIRQWRKHDWPHLRVHRYIDLQAGQRYYDSRGAKLDDGTASSDLSLERLECMEVRWGGDWVPLEPSIGLTQYANWDSDTDERSWPVERWQVYEDEMFEIWPIPSANAETGTLEGRLRLTGIRDLRTLVADDDRADLDNDLIVKYAVLQTLARKGSKDAQVVLDEAKGIEAGPNRPGFVPNSARCAHPERGR